MDANNIYKIMRENGGMGSIVDGVFVGGNPNANTKSVRSRGSISADNASDKKIAVQKRKTEKERLFFENKAAKDYKRAEQLKSLKELKANKKTESDLSLSERKATLEEKKARILAARAAKNNSN